MTKYTYNNKIGLSIAITNLNAYNNGSLLFEWLDLPFNDEEFKSTLNKIGINSINEEYFISDFNNYLNLNIKLSEYENIHRLNKLLTLLDELEEYDYIKLQAYCEHEGSLDVKQIIQLLEDEELENIYLYEEVTSDKELGEYLIDNDYIEIPDHLNNYIDHESLGRDYRFEHSGSHTEYGYIEC